MTDKVKSAFMGKLKSSDSGYFGGRRDGDTQADEDTCMSCGGAVDSKGYALGGDVGDGDADDEKDGFKNGPDYVGSRRKKDDKRLFVRALKGKG